MHGPADPLPGLARGVETVAARRWLLLVVCLIGVLALRAPGLTRHIFNPDEAYVQTEATVVGRGGDLYRDVVDRKPPGMPLVTVAAADVGLPPVLRYRVPALVAMALTAWLLGLEARRRFGRATAVPAALGFLLAAVAVGKPSVTQAANEETFVAFTMTAALVLAGRRRWWLAGVAIAAGLLTRQTAVFLVPAVAVAAHRSDRGPRTSSLGARLRWPAPLLVPAPIVLAVVAGALGWRDYWFWNGSGASAGFLGLPTNLHVTHAFASQAILPFLAGTAAIVCCAALGADKWRAEADLWLWVAGALVASTATLRFVDHYFLQVLPGLVLLGAAGWTAVPTRAARRMLVLVALVPACLGITGAWLALGDGGGLGDVAAYVRANSRPGDRVWVWGSLPEVYTLSGRLPGTRFVTNGFLTGHVNGMPDNVADGPVPGAWAAFARDVRAHPPRLILDLSPSGARGSADYPIARYPRLASLVARDYRRKGSVLGVVVYEHR